MRTLLSLIGLTSFLQLVSAYGGNSSQILADLKKKFPERRIENVIYGDFKEWLAISKVGDKVRIGVVKPNQSFSEVSIDWGRVTETESLILYPFKDSSGTYSRFIEHSVYWKTVHLYQLSRGYCTTPYNMSSNGHRHTYTIGPYMRINIRQTIRMGDFNCGDKIMTQDIAKLPTDIVNPSVKKMLSRCWSAKGEETCVQNEDDHSTLLANRHRPILHTQGITIYAHCCPKKRCKNVDARCSYFLYDHLSGVDFYIDDQLNWTSDTVKDPLVLFPIISKDDDFVTKRRYNFFPDKPNPIPPVPICPSSNCCNGFSFNFGAIFGNLPKLSMPGSLNFSKMPNFLNFNRKKQ